MLFRSGGGRLLIQLYNSTQNEERDGASPIAVSVDGVVRSLPAGGIIVLAPGESITLPPYSYHKFWAEGGRVLAGEISMVNDDVRDNRFYEPVGRFPAIEEDEPPLYLLVTDYERYYSV